MVKVVNMKIGSALFFVFHKHLEASIFKNALVN